MNETTLVIYTDGGCRKTNNSSDVGYAGWGVHGYLAELTPPKKGLGLGTTIATVNGYKPKEDSPEVNVPVTVLGYLDASGGLADSTNNKAELMSAITALNYVLITCKHGTSVGDTIVKPTSALILADSKYFLEGFTDHLDQWSRNNWRKLNGEPLKNTELWSTLHELKIALQLAGVSLRLQYVKAHDGNLGNETADEWASNGIVLSFKKDLECLPVTLYPADGYWADGEHNRMFCAPKLYFNCHAVGDNMSPDGRHVYYIGDHDKDNLLAGKPISSNTFGILYLKEPELILENVKKLQDAVTPYGRGSLVFGRLDNIYATKLLTKLKRHGTKFIHRDPKARNMDLSYNLFPKHIPVTEEMYPPRMGYAIMDVINTLEDKLELYLKNRDLVCVTDITDLLYERTETKGKVKVQMRKEFGVTTKTISPTVKYVLNGEYKELDLLQTFGIDLMPRNDLSALAAPDLKVKIITWPESSVTFKYASIVETDDNVALYCAGYSNRRVVG